MNKQCRPVCVVYSAGELKQAFEKVRADQLALGGDDLSNPMGQSQCAFRRASDALDVLKRYDDQDFLVLPAKPSELAMPTDELSKSFLEYYQAGQCVNAPVELADHLRGIAYN